MKFPLVSVLTVSYNSKEHLHTCFSSLRKINYPKGRYEVILIDNKSQDGSAEYVKKNFKWVKVVTLDKNYGLDAALNRGVKISKGKYIVFLNPDTEVEKDWLIELVKTMETDDKIGSCGSKALYYNDRNKINSIGGFWSFLGFSGSLGEGKNKDEFNTPIEVFFPTGCSMMIRRDLFQSVNGFDEYYFMYVEEPDITWKLWNLGYKCVFVPTSVMYHKVSTTLRRSRGSGFKPLMYYHSTKNRLSTIIKNARLTDLIWMLPLSIVAHIFQAFLFLIRARFDNFAAVLTGIMWVFAHTNILFEKRRGAVYNDKANKMMIGIVDSLNIFIGKFKKHF